MSDDSEAFEKFKQKYFPPEFTKYWDVKQNNFAATVQAFPHLWKAFLLADDLIQKELNLHSTITDPAQIVAFMLGTHAHAQLRVCIGLAFEGSLKEAGSVIRGAIESIAFADHLHREPQKAQIWFEGYRGKAQKKAYKDAFKDNRKEKLFSNSADLQALYKHWCAFSEDSSHTSVRDVARRVQFNETQTHLNWFVHYFETDPKVLALSLFTLLHAMILIERVLFAIFRQRLELVPELVKDREMLVRYFEQVRRELITAFKLKNDLYL